MCQRRQCPLKALACCVTFLANGKYVHVHAAEQWTARYHFNAFPSGWAAIERNKYLGDLRVRSGNHKQRAVNRTDSSLDLAAEMPLCEIRVLPALAQDKQADVRFLLGQLVN